MTALAGFLLGLALAFGSAQVCPNGCCKDARGPHCPANGRHQTPYGPAHSLTSHGRK